MWKAFYLNVAKENRWPNYFFLKHFDCFLITQKRLGNKETENKKEKIGFFMFRLVIPLKLTYVKFSIDISKSSFVTAF